MRVSIFVLLFCFSGLLNAQNVTFQNVSHYLEVPHTFGDGSEMAGGVSFVDFDQDGFDDLTFTTNDGNDMSFYINDGTGNMMKWVFPGVDNDGNTKHPLWADIDNDGDYDLFISANESGNRLYLNHGDLNLEDITETSGLDLPSVDNNSFGSVFADFNKDGNLDLYIVNRTLNGNYLPEHNLMNYGNGDGTFNNVGVQTNTQDSFQAPFCPIAFDYDKDGFEDIYIAQDKSYGNTMLRNLDGFSFDDTSETSDSDIIMDGMNGDVADLDGNGYLDIFITNTSEGAVLLMNNGDGTFTDEALERGVKVPGEAAWGGIFVDIENDGDLDLFVSMGSFSTTWHDNLLINDGTGFFTEADSQWGLESVPVDYSFGNMFGDINGNGFPDLVVSNHYANSLLWRSSGNENNWLKYKLEGTVSNRDGIGSYLNFYYGGVPQLRSTHCGQGFLSQQSYTKIFGLGTKESSDSLSVLWPSGHVDWYYDLVSDSTYQFLEGETIELSLEFTNGSDLCPGESTEISISGDYEQVLWNGDTEAPTYTVNSAQTVTAEITYEFGIVQSYEIEIGDAGIGFELMGINGLTICPGEIEDQVEIVVQSDNPFELFIDETLSDLTPSLEIGEHSIRVVDSSGCIIEEQFSIVYSQDPEFNIVTDDVLCFGEDNGSIALLIEAAEPFNFTIDQAETGLFVSSLAANDYLLNVVDGYNCSFDSLITISEPEVLSVIFNSGPDQGSNEGSISVEVSGGSAPYTLNGDALTELQGLAQGFYDVEICDANNCCVEDEIEVEFTIGMEEKEKELLVLYPNPTPGEITIQNFTGKISDLVLMDALGKEVNYSVTAQTDNQVVINLAHLTTGKYYLKNLKDSTTFEINKN